MPDLKARELWAVGPLIALIIGLGVYPQPVLDIINPAVQHTMTQTHSVDPAPQVGGSGGPGGSSPRASTAAAPAAAQSGVTP
jgi:hypothetical protein